MTDNMVKNTPMLNMVDGFDPSRYVRETLDEDGSRSLYLDVKYRLLWFRMKHPEAKITSAVVHVDEKSAVVCATLYSDRNDPADSYLARSYAQRFISQEKFGDRYLEIAETAALGRALAAAGYGTQFCASPEEGGRDIIADSPVEIRDANDEAQLSPEPRQTVYRQPSPAPQIANCDSRGNPSPAAPVSLDDYLHTMSIEEAQQVVVDIGYNKGMTLGQLAVNKPRDLEWYVNHYSGHNLRLKAGSIILLNAARVQAG